MLVCGLDEAGRGAVVGKLVISGVLIEEENWDKFVSLGVKDSKLLSAKKRKELFGEIKKISKGVKAVEVSAREIDSFMTTGTNLNMIELVKMAKIINHLNPDKAYIDSPWVNIEAFKKTLREHLERDCELVVEYKADMRYALVGAASIISKVIRDKSIEELKRKLGLDLGSGYPSDDKTREFVKRAITKQAFLKYVRTTWQTVREIRSDCEQRKLAQF